MKNLVLVHLSSVNKSVMSRIPSKYLPSLYFFLSYDRTKSVCIMDSSSDGSVSNKSAYKVRREQKVGLFRSHMYRNVGSLPTLVMRAIYSLQSG